MNLINSQSLYTIIQRLTILGKDKFIEEEEARYARQIVSLADEIVENDIELVLLAGPSGSGKTTTAHNLRKELMCRLMGEGHYVYCLSMDDWYMSADRYTMPVDEEGQPDYESPDCLDVPRLNRDLNDLFAGREVSLPTYNFITRRSVESGAKIELKKGDVVIAISNSGETMELEATVQTLIANGAHIISCTGNPQSTLAKQSEVCLVAHVDEEGDALNKPPRASILSEILILQCLSVVLQEAKKLDLNQYVKWHPGGSLGKSIKELQK